MGHPPPIIFNAEECSGKKSAKMISLNHPAKKRPGDSEIKDVGYPICSGYPPTLTFRRRAAKYDRMSMKDKFRNSAGLVKKCQNDLL